MITFVLFAVSGVAIITITAAKRMGERKKTTVLILRLISLGDERLRGLHHEALRHYSSGKDKFGFWFKKQLPLKLKSFLNRFLTYAREKSVEYLGDMRGSRLLKRSDGISEFFKNISEIEKGGGEINDTLETITDDFYIQTSVERHAEAERMRAEALVIETVETNVSKKSRAPRKKTATSRSSKNVPVLEVLD